MQKQRSGEYGNALRAILTPRADPNQAIAYTLTVAR
jgi:hypothetical protein